MLSQFSAFPSPSVAPAQSAEAKFDTSPGPAGNPSVNGAIKPPEISEIRNLFNKNKFSATSRSTSTPNEFTFDSMPSRTSRFSGLP